MSARAEEGVYFYSTGLSKRWCDNMQTRVYWTHNTDFSRYDALEIVIAEVELRWMLNVSQVGWCNNLHRRWMVSCVGFSHSEFIASKRSGCKQNCHWLRAVGIAWPICKKMAFLFIYLFFRGKWLSFLEFDRLAWLNLKFSPHFFWAKFSPHIRDPERAERRPSPRYSQADRLVQPKLSAAATPMSSPSYPATAAAVKLPCYSPRSRLHHSRTPKPVVSFPSSTPSTRPRRHTHSPQSHLASVFRSLR